ncbi:MAG: DUF2470 domain-containing protein [Gordonia sp.]|jgi:hypothetical protein|uniref:DUF2470 domain-containing protein n=1 Tax=Gordonia rubripertincta TaxID=36822 RepID=A0ABT4MQX5_GORRU|nr:MULTISPECIES: DUF2470 domain-containing protein [Mycobacteriales]MBA4025641.1 DUF2470 domain-containing protein [Gordonia sp. (in: high G+C Gram-positive bacteria)]MCZ4549404.1 DUF2470 domain-containing protein [Gordonia rubripertincta]OZG28958.1 DUF2470 domain-containing protein [Williamsia sp. 1138]
MQKTAIDRPSDAESVRTACMRVTDAMLAIEGSEPSPVTMVHLYDSQAFVLVPTDSAASALAWQAGSNGLPAMVEVTDVAPIDLREQVRSLIWLNGTLHSVPSDLERDLACEIATDHPCPGLLDIGHGYSLLRLGLTSAVLANSGGAASVSSDELAQAVPDPFWEFEADWVAHMDSDHADLITALSNRLPTELRDGRVRPLGIDRFGIRFRIEGPDSDSDVRLPFPRPVGDVMELSKALRTLAGCPFLNSLPGHS